MKRLIILLSLILLIAIFSSYLSEPSFELISSSVTITNDKNKTGSIGITEGEKKGQELVPTALYYEFTVKNIGNTKIGGFANKVLLVKIE